MAEPAQPTHTQRSRGYVLFLLTCVYAFNFIDRQILGILSPLIKEDLGLSDAQLGLLKGFAFALFYTAVGIPVAWLADRYNRVTIVSWSLAVWSGFTALTGLVGSYGQMFLTRMGVGIGEAGGSPPSHSILSDLYPRERRAAALGVYGLGIPFGLMAAYFATAYLLSGGGMHWRGVMISLGLPGVALALLVKLTIKEPERGAADAADHGPTLTLGETLKILLTIPSWWGMCAGIAFASFGSYAVGNWIIDYFARAHPDFDLIHLLIILGCQHALAYGLGTWLGGVCADRWARTNQGAYAWVAAWSLLAGVPALIACFWLADPRAVVLLLTVYLFAAGFYLGPSFFVAQTLAPISARAMSTALFFFVLNLIALGGGPSYVGWTSSLLTEAHGETHALRLAMTSLVVPFALSIVAFSWTARRLPADLARAGR